MRGLGETVEKETVETTNLYRLRRDGYRFGTDDLLARLNDGVHWLGVTRDGLREVIARAGSIGYVVDNAGEFQFDKALIKRLAELGREVVVLCQVRAVRGGRYRGVRH
ncbi:ARMT1-like domain-containing protein [Caldivirga sp. MU80]|uniref:ARMT1-like domain-containing protein n=1 Tax=Caldivirga sp. MU80 TaxID=1650354 RepID=UPI0012E89A5E|nr:ARMT1-like domain-containing protein [Caldivirga sp. MU80]